VTVSTKGQPRAFRSFENREGDRFLRPDWSSRRDLVSSQACLTHRKSQIGHGSFSVKLTRSERSQRPFDYAIAFSSAFEMLPRW